MAISKFWDFWGFLCLYTLYFSEDVTCLKRCKNPVSKDGILMPRRGCLMDLTTFRTQVANTIWRPFYFGSVRPRELTFFDGEFRYSFPDNDTSLMKAFSGALPNGTCVDENTLPGNEDGFPPYDVISKKAEFLADSFSYLAFLKSDPADRYLVSVECFLPRPVRRCPIERTVVILYVLDPRPDSVPLHRALKDIRLATCLTLDFVSGNFRFQFNFGEQISISSGGGVVGRWCCVTYGAVWIKAEQGPTVIAVAADMVVGSSKSFNVQLDDDNDTPWITGAEFLSEGRFVLSDWNNNRLKLLSSDFSMVDSLLLQSEPWGVTAVNSTTVIVTLPWSKLLQYVHVLPHFSKSSKIQLDKKCWGVDVVGEEIFTSCFNRWFTYDGEVMVYDLGGSLKRQLGVNQDKSYMFKDPAYLSVSSNTGNIYVSDWRTDKVTCFSSAGDVIYQYDDPELDDPTGVYLDHADDIIVLGRRSHNAHVVTASGKKYRILLTSSDGIQDPRAIAYRQSDATLVIGSYDNSNLLVFKLEN